MAGGGYCRASVWSAWSLLPLSYAPANPKAPASWTHSTRFASQRADRRTNGCGEPRPPARKPELISAPPLRIAPRLQPGRHRAQPPPGADNDETAIVELISLAACLSGCRGSGAQKPRPWTPQPPAPAKWRWVHDVAAISPARPDSRAPARRPFSFRLPARRPRKCSAGILETGCRC